MKQSTKVALEIKLLKWFRKLFRYTPSEHIYNIEERKMVRIQTERIIPELDMTLPVTGAKTLRPGDALYFQEVVWHVSIYCITNTSVELVLKRD